MGLKGKCKLDFCDKEIVVVRDQLCAAHYAQVTRYGFDEPRPIRNYKKEKKCDAPWCERLVYERTLCIPCYKRRTRYKMTLDEYINSKQICEVCGTTEKIHVDHDHETGKWRGMLCSPCNTSLGFLQENPDRIMALAEYAKRVNNV